MNEYLQELIDSRTDLQRDINALNQIKHSVICENPLNMMIVSKRLDRLRKKKYRITEKIREIAPDLFPKKWQRGNVSRKSPLSLNMPVFDGKKTLMDFVAFKNAEEADANDAEYVDIVRDSIRFLSPQQASTIDMRYNRGMSLAAIAKELHLGETTVRTVLKRGVESMRLWIRIQLAVRKAQSERGFQWELFLNEVPEIFTVRQRRAITLLTGEQGKRLYTLAEIMSELGYVPSRLSQCHPSWSYSILSILKRTLLQLGIPEQDINAMHYIMKMAPKLPPQSDYNFMVKTLKASARKSVTDEC